MLTLQLRVEFAIARAPRATFLAVNSQRFADVTPL